MEKISLGMASFALSYILVESLMIDMKVKRWFKIPKYQSLTPLDCAFCLSWWIGLVWGSVALGFLSGIQVGLTAVFFYILTQK